MSQTPAKLQEIHKACRKQYKNTLMKFAGSFIFIVIGIVSLGVILMTFDWQKGIWLQSPTNLIFFVIGISSMLIALFMTTLTEIPPLEKLLFLRTVKAYEHLTRYISLTGSSLQKQSDLEESEKLLHRVSSSLVARKDKAGSLDIIKEVNEKYAKLGKIIETKIIHYLKKRKELPLIQQMTLELADTLGDVSLKRLDSCIETIETMKESGTFERKPTFLESHYRLRSAIIRGGRFLVSTFLVLAVAIILSFVFSKPLSEFAPYILTSIFVVFVSWEFKSKVD